MTVKPAWARKRDRLQHREAVAVAADTAGPPKPDVAPAEANTSRWTLSAAECRNLVITFVGGLASIVAATCIIAGAIAIDRFIARNNHGHIDWANEAISTGVLLLFGAFLVWLRPGKWLSRFYFVFYGLTLPLLLLIWIGLAAGVH